MARFCLLLKCLLVFLTVQPALGQTEMRFPQDVRPDRVPKNLSDTPNQALKCFLNQEGAPFYSDPSLSQELAKGRFLDAYHIAGKDADGRSWFLVTAASELDYPDLPVRQWHGWVRREHCLVYTGYGPEGLKDPYTHIHRKAMLVNRLGGSGGSTALSPLVSFVDRPNAQGVERRRRALFDIYYVFAEMPEYLLLGTEPRVERAGSQEDVLLGWVPKGRACVWNTREAVEFNKRDIAVRTQPCRIFLHADELKAYLDIRNLNRVAPIGEEDIQVKQWKHFQARYPLIDDEERRQVLEQYKDTKIYKVGVIGDVFRADGSTGAPQMLVSARRVDELKEKVRQLQERVSKIQVCFLIDATFSMDRWIKAAAAAVNKIVAGVQDRVKRKGVSQKTLEISVNFYRDKEDGPLALDFNPFLGPQAAIDLLEKQRACGGGQPYEMMFAAVCRRLEAKDAETASHMAFDPEAVKILIVIGDDGNHPNDTEYILERVCKQILEAGGSSSVGFLAFPVGPDSPYRRAFIAQTREISRRLSAAQAQALSQGGQADPEIRSRLQELVGQVVVTDNAEQIVSAIDARFQLALTEMEVRQRELAYLKTGTSVPEAVAEDRENTGESRARQKYGVIWKQRMTELIRREKLDLLELARQGVQIFSEGWVAEYDPAETAPPDAPRPPTIRHVVLMHKSELRKFSVMLGVALDRWDPTAMGRTWQEALDTITGGEVRLGPTKTPMELMQIHLGIKVKYGLLALTFNELARQNVGELVKLHWTLKECLARANDALDEQEADYHREADKSVLRRTNQRPRKYWWHGDQQSGDARAWIDRDVLP